MIRITICILLVISGVYVGTRIGSSPSLDLLEASAGDSSLASIQLPSKYLEPAEVVRLQIDALQRFRAEQAAIRQCYLLASPANRSVTGPLPRFAAMVHTQPFRALIYRTQALVGKPVIQGDQATVLVTVLGENQSVQAFRFFLSLQSKSPYDGCWMTEAVYPVSSPVDRESVTPSADIPSADNA